MKEIEIPIIPQSIDYNLSYFDDIIPSFFFLMSVCTYILKNQNWAL